MYSVGQWEGPARLASKRQAAASPKTGPKIETPCWGSAVPKQPSKGSCCAPPIVCVFLRSLKGSEMGAGGVRWPCLGTESTQATCGVPFPRGMPVFTLSTVLVLFGPKRGLMAPGRAPAAVPWGRTLGPYLGAESAWGKGGLPLGQWPPDGPEMGLKWLWKWKNLRFFSKSVPGPFGVLGHAL